MLCNRISVHAPKDSPQKTNRFPKLEQVRESSPESHEALNPAEEQTKNPLSEKTQFKTTSDGT